VLGKGNSGDDCAAFFPEINRPKKGPISPLGGLYSFAVLFAGVTSSAAYERAIERQKCLICLHTFVRSDHTGGRTPSLLDSHETSQTLYVSTPVHILPC